jgi:hypothetical protein
MPCKKGRFNACLDEEALRSLEEARALLKRPASYILSDAVKLYTTLLKRGYLHAAWSMALGIPIVVNNVNVEKNYGVVSGAVDADLEVNLYAADIEMLRGVFQSILRDVERGADLRAAVASRARALEKAARRIKTVDHPEVAQWRDAALKLLGAINGKTAREEALKLLKKYARQ